MRVSHIDSSFGKIRIESTEKGISSIVLDHGGATDHSKNPSNIAVDLSTYLMGGRPDLLKYNLDLGDATDFQKAIWNAARTIPYGKTATYSQIAAMAGRPKTVRAAGSALGANPIPLLIPCHRVVAKAGIGGFSYGLKTKSRLLEMESHLSSERIL